MSQREKASWSIQSAHKYASQVEEGDREGDPVLAAMLVGIAIAEAIVLVAETIEMANASQMARGR